MSVADIAKCQKQMTPRGRLIELFTVCRIRSQVSALIIGDLRHILPNQQLSQKTISRVLRLLLVNHCFTGDCEN